MKIQMTLFKEKRQFGRIKIPESTICQVYVPHPRKITKGYRALIRNISLGGIYFVCYEKPPLEKDDIRYLIFNVIYNYHKIYRLKFHALVVRSENEGFKFGVALKFLSDPIYYQLEEVNDGDLPFVDKLRIMYQNYELNKKAYAIIRKTPDIRTERINTIKKIIDQGIYKIEHKRLAHWITDNLMGTFENSDPGSRTETIEDFPRPKRS